METKIANHYRARMERVLAHIDAHLDENLSVDRLSGVACFSRYHFQRQFSALFGIGVHRYVQLLRLKRASYRLAFRQGESVTAIALDSGYEGPEAFSRAFRQRLGQSPSAFRAEPDWSPWHAATAPLTQARSTIMTQSLTVDNVRIIDFPETHVAMMEHRGDPRRIGDTVRRFIDWRRANGLHPGKSSTLNIFHDDPDSTPPAGYRMSLCAGVTAHFTANADDIEIGTIPEGRCAVLRLTGSSDNLQPAFAYLYGEWLPESGQELRDFPPFAQRVRFFPDVPEHEAVTDIFLPIA
ncbi:AraC family transcriptional regulator [Allosphingosinicella vermicomposti]|uniref:AraC family transcriptional regulator n=1 Tax=Allosphingosinicella vermicomposti TaxID=614671 RepID=UPI000D0F028F|nr:AraC family transcriptional regulator [Allosphingosinicella vermicomposti]